MFNKAMMQMEVNLPILGMFPFSSLKTEVEAEPERAFMADIGGGRGQCLLEVQKEISGFSSPPKMILQDRPAVLDTIPDELVLGIEKMAYDYYTEQPVKSTFPSPSPSPVYHSNITQTHTSTTSAASCTTTSTGLVSQYSKTSRKQWDRPLGS